MGAQRKQPMKKPDLQWLTTSEAARYLGISADKMRELDDTGELRASRTNGDHRRFSQKALDAYRAGNDHHDNRKATRPGALKRVVVRSTHVPKTFDDEPEDFEQGDEMFEPFIEATPPPPPPASPLEQLAREMEERRKRDAEQAPLRRLTTLKQYGLRQVPYGTPDSWRAKVAVALENFVMPKSFPDWIGDAEAYRIVRGKVEELLHPYREEVARKKTEEARKEEEARNDRHVKHLIESGKAYASSQTLLNWGYDDRARFLRDVKRMLEDSVESDWTEQDVKDAVDDELSEWDDEDADEDDEDDEPTDDDTEYDEEDES